LIQPENIPPNGPGPAADQTSVPGQIPLQEQQPPSVQLPGAVSLPVPEIKPHFWSAWATIGLGTAVFSIYSVVQTLVLVVFAVIKALNEYSSISQIDPYKFINSLSTDGLMLSLAIILGGIIGLGFILLFVKVRRGISIPEYLALKPISLKTIPALFGVLVVLVGISVGISLLSGDIKTTDPISQAYSTMKWPALFWIASVVFAPIFEESLFRGFIFSGLQVSRLGTAGTIVLTGLVFALLHAFQYGAGVIAQIFVLGIVFGLVRWKTKSLYTTIGLHAAWNLLQLLILTFASNLGT
jgi:uncharacterized protein